jgi:hypothetical protein
MKHAARFVFLMAGIGALILGAITTSPGRAAAANRGGSQTCTGTVDSPGTLAGSYSNVVIKGACVANAGPVHVAGSLVIAPGGALTAIWGLNDQTGTGNSNVTVGGNLVVSSGASLMLGCYPRIVALWGVTQILDLPDFPCLDDPNPNAPTLTAHDVIRGNLIAYHPLGVVTHAVTIRGNAIQAGGGAGTGCAPVGIFNKYLGLPEYSTYTNDWVAGNLIVHGLDTCWTGVLRDKVAGNMILTHNIGAPDSNEYATNRVYGNLICAGNHPAAELGDSNGRPNKVAGQATGGCGFNVILPNPGYHSGVECPPCHRTFQPASVKLNR